MGQVLDRSLEGAVALITGAAGGLGRALVSAFSDAGAQVIGTDLNFPIGEDAALTLRHDVTSAEGWADVIKQVKERFGRLDCVVNNAGISPPMPVAETSLADWRRIMAVNSESALLGTHAALDLLRTSGSSRQGGASIVNIGSAAAVHGVAFLSAYAASKAALAIFGKSAAQEFLSLGWPIRVNTLHPTALDTNMQVAMAETAVELGLFSTREDMLQAVAARHPLKRMGRPEEVAGAAVFLCSEAASFINGASLSIDGGAAV